MKNRGLWRIPHNTPKPDWLSQNCWCWVTTQTPMYKGLIKSVWLYGTASKHKGNSGPCSTYCGGLPESTPPPSWVVLSQFPPMALPPCPTSKCRKEPGVSPWLGCLCVPAPHSHIHTPQSSRPTVKPAPADIQASTSTQAMCCNLDTVVLLKVGTEAWPRWPRSEGAPTVTLTPPCRLAPCFIERRSPDQSLRLKFMASSKLLSYNSYFL